MAKSQIIKDLANSTIDVGTALKRAKVLFSELGNEELLKWVNCEISGYPDNASLPDYRVLRGTLIGSYMKGSMANHLKWTNVSIPLGKMPEETKDALLSVYLFEGVDALEHLIQFNENPENRLGKQIPADCFPLFNKYNNDPFMIITSARVEVSTHNLSNVISIIENRLLDSLLLLEKEFGNLDELDIDTSGKSTLEIEEIANKITVLVYNDNRVTIGDGNKIKDSSINTPSE
jgi:hypothetical protein